MVIREFETVTRYQHIKLEKDPDYGLTLYLDGHWQFSEADIATYHEPLGLYAGMCVKHGSKALIIGGGDGFIAAELLKLDIPEIDLVEIDEEVVKLCRTQDVAKLNNRSLNDPRVNVVIADFKEFIRGCSKLYDLIIMDLPSDLISPPGHMQDNYAGSTFRGVKRLLRPDGVFAAQMSMPYMMELRSMRELVSIYKFVQSVDVGYSWGDDEMFTYCSGALLSWVQKLPSTAKFLTPERVSVIGSTVYLTPAEMTRRELLTSGGSY